MNDAPSINAASVGSGKLDLRRAQLPYTVKVGNVAFRIHSYKKRKGKKSYVCYPFRWRDGDNRRKTMDNADLNTLITAARTNSNSLPK
jgi:hypothetical protein